MSIADELEKKAQERRIHDHYSDNDLPVYADWVEAEAYLFDAIAEIRRLEVRVERCEMALSDVACQWGSVQRLLDSVKVARIAVDEAGKKA